MKLKLKQTLIVIPAAVILCISISAAHAAEGKKQAQPARAGQIEATAAVMDTHPPIEQGMSCNDCHEIRLDANTTATQVWISGDYLKWKAGEGVMTKGQVWERILAVFKQKEMKRTFVMATCFNNRPYTLYG